MFGVAHRGIMTPWGVEQPIFEEHVLRIICVGFCVSMALSPGTCQAQVYGKETPSFKGLNFTASTYSPECKNGDFWGWERHGGGQWGTAGQPCLAPRAPSQGVSAWFLCLVTHRAHNRTVCCGVRSVDGVLQSMLQM